MACGRSPEIEQQNILLIGLLSSHRLFKLNLNSVAIFKEGKLVMTQLTT